MPTTRWFVFAHEHGAESIKVLSYIEEYLNIRFGKTTWMNYTDFGTYIEKYTGTLVLYYKNIYIYTHTPLR